MDDTAVSALPTYVVLHSLLNSLGALDTPSSRQPMSYAPHLYTTGSTQFRCPVLSLQDSIFSFHIEKPLSFMAMVEAFLTRTCELILAFGQDMFTFTTCLMWRDPNSHKHTLTAFFDGFERG